MSLDLVFGCDEPHPSVWLPDPDKTWDVFKRWDAYRYYLPRDNCVKMVRLTCSFENTSKNLRFQVPQLSISIEKSAAEENRISSVVDAFVEDG